MAGAVDPPWPRSFRLKPKPNGSRVLFSHDCFQGPQGLPPEVLYSDNLTKSEQLARDFLDEAVVGFDMEWVWPETEVLKGRVALIQVASESKIALFHIGRHDGDAADQLIAPSLRTLIESPTVLKTGQSIMGDFYRLNKYFQLQPKGAIELSYFQVLVNPGRPNFNSFYYPGGLRGLVEKYFPGYTLKKTEHMHKDWLAPLETNQELIQYAVADAYAGLMIYHRLNALRLNMQPCPPLPARVEETRAYKEHTSGVFPEPKPIYLQSIHPHGSSRQASWFFSMEEDDEVSTELDTDSRALYDRLVELRQKIANEEEIHPGQLTTDCTLRHIASTRIATTDECIKLRGIFPQLRKILAREYAKVVNAFQEEIQSAAANQQPEHGSPKIGEDAKGTVSDPPQMPAEETGQAHTGLSFSMAETGIATDGHTGSDTESESDADETTEVLAIYPSAGVEQDQDTDNHKDDAPLKRKRSTSPQTGRQPPAKSS
ncbi:uncharacterized protein J4E88_005448 [Alternaria novae-zelandiae]|uniref:uncharacterized protein n=1 Tax=Alternaria novae-zelandiae TaxID=430562 RepID=UPI0020C2480C|nr:uncharacterized protein J4E88_005448 [Alternaria novae-zelandiae]KAI4680943.1 hypothetical protein J4E88_005448 [Alternaria novae-zelandiae]